MDLNAYTLAQREGSMDKVEALTHWNQSDLFDEYEKIVLEYTDAVTYTDQKVTDELMRRLSKYLDADAIIELTALIAFQNMSSKFNSAIDAPSQGFCQLPSIETRRGKWRY